MSSSPKALCITLFLAAAARAQESPAPPPTLHVYTNLVQIPVLVLSPNREKIYRPIPGNRFSIHLDDGLTIHPTYARLEGEDPIDLAIVLDPRDPGDYVMPKISSMIADLAPKYLHPQDHVSLYVLDCGRIYPALNLPADPAQLKSGADRALTRWSERVHQKHAPPCTANTNIYDVLSFVTHSLAKQPGRRVVLAISTGEDRKSIRSGDDLVSIAQVDGVTLFGISTLKLLPSNTLSPAHVDPFATICESSGGLVLTPTASTLAKNMQRFVEMLRERYILEFPRPPYAVAGRHIITVTIANISAFTFIRSAGVSVPLARPSETSPLNQVIDTPVIANPAEASSAPAASAPTVISLRTKQ